MEIIHRRQNHINKFATWHCSQCGSTIKSSINEGTYINDQRDGDYISVDCPVCLQQNFIDIKKYKVENKEGGSFEQRQQ